MFQGKRKPEVIQKAEEDVPPEPILNKEERWRYDQLHRSGFTETQSLMLALNREVDLHKARDLVKAAGNILAFQILS